MARWRQILERIDARDEGGVLPLINVMDEFCDEAARSRAEGEGARKRPSDKARTAPIQAGADPGLCLFCRGFADWGGCLAQIGLLNEAVLHHRWEEARRIALDYLEGLKGMSIDRLLTPGRG